MLQEWAGGLEVEHLLEQDGLGAGDTDPLQVREGV